MREIKFRAWDLREKKMKNGYNDGEERFLLLQFTGLHDKNGKEIYEGDITNNGVVVWNEALTWDSGGSSHPGFYFDAPRFDGDLNYHTSFDDDTEVIGNIYENPELLKEK